MTNKIWLYYQDDSQELISFGILNLFTILVNSNRVWLFLLGFVFIEYMFLNSVISFILLDCSTTLSRVGSSYPSRRARFLSQTIFSGNNICNEVLSLKFTLCDLILDEQFILHTLKFFSFNLIRWLLFVNFRQLIEVEESEQQIRLEDFQNTKLWIIIVFSVSKKAVLKIVNSKTLQFVLNRHESWIYILTYFL